MHLFRLVPSFSYSSNEVAVAIIFFTYSSSLSSSESVIKMSTSLNVLDFLIVLVLCN